MKILNIVVSLLFFSCANKSSINSTESIEIHYMRPYVSTPFSYSCDMINKMVLKNDIHIKEFKDSTTINKFISIYKNYEIEPNIEGGINTRIKVIINTMDMQIKNTV